MAQRNPLDRSLAFTALLEQDPEGFGKMSDPEAGQMMSDLLTDFYESSDADMWKYTQRWLAGRQEAAERAADVPGPQAPEPASQEDMRALRAELDAREDPDKPWQVTAQVSRVKDGWQSSRQVPTFTIPRALAYSKEDAEAKAREIINPYREPYDLHMDVTTDYVTTERQPEPERQVLDGDEQQLGAVQEGQAEADAEAWGTRGPSASYDEWVAEGQEDAGPGERQLEDWNEHNYGGPSASREKWQAEGCDLGEDVRPGEKLWDVPGDQERGQ
jgi:hypothetical protein